MSEEIKTLFETLRHITLVQGFLQGVAAKLVSRATLHDESKFRPDEFLGFVKIKAVDKDYGYNSPQYKDALKDGAIQLHQQRNSHHPEYHKKGVDDMTFLDFVEMVADWKVAGVVYAHGTGSIEKSIELNVDRFGLKDNHIWLIRLISDAMDQE